MTPHTSFVTSDLNAMNQWVSSIRGLKGLLEVLQSDSYTGSIILFPFLLQKSSPDVVFPTLTLTCVSKDVSSSDSGGDFRKFLRWSWTFVTILN